MSDIPSFLRTILSEVNLKSGDLIERWVDLYFNLARTFGGESYHHQPDLWVDLILRKMEDDIRMRYPAVVAFSAGGDGGGRSPELSAIVLRFARVTAATSITAATFSFGTGPRALLHPVPLPPAALLFGTALLGVGAFARRRKKFTPAKQLSARS